MVVITLEEMASEQLIDGQIYAGYVYELLMDDSHRQAWEQTAREVKAGYGSNAVKELAARIRNYMESGNKAEWGKVYHWMIEEVLNSVKDCVYYEIARAILDKA